MSNMKSVLTGPMNICGCRPQLPGTHRVQEFLLTQGDTVVQLARNAFKVQCMLIIINVPRPLFDRCCGDSFSADRGRDVINNMAAIKWKSQSGFWKISVFTNICWFQWLKISVKIIQDNGYTKLNRSFYPDAEQCYAKPPYLFGTSE